MTKVKVAGGVVVGAALGFEVAYFTVRFTVKCLARRCPTCRKAAIHLRECGNGTSYA